MALAYAALVSLMNVIDNIRTHPRFSTSLDEKQVESLGEKLDFLLDFIESNHSHELLESQIASAVHAAEDVIESHVVDQIHSGSISVLDLQTIIEDIDSVKDKVVNFMEERGLFNVHQQYSLSATSSTPLITSSGKSTVTVGSDEELIQLLDALTGQQSSLQIIPIVGMGGIGKTTLARNAYERRLILNHFDVRAWATISQEYSVKEIFSKLLSCSQSTDEQQLAQQLYQSLIGRRYLIILDDIWSIDVWDKIKFFFPDNNNGSRIIVTTRLSNIAIHFGSSYLSKKFLDKSESWKLFCESAFSEEGCPPELEEIGMKISEKCQGLPLLIVVIGGLLRKSSRTGKYWENISGDINSLFDSGEEHDQSLDILSLSYKHLPAHLKPCFLYLAIIPEDYLILVSQLINLWVAEGFIKPSKTQSMEEVAKCYVKDLVDRNLILVRSLRLNGKIKCCSMYDLVRDLCIKTAQKEKFLCMMRIRDIPRGVNKERRIVFHEKIPKEKNDHKVFFHELESASLARSLIGKRRGELSFKFKLLRVLHMIDFPPEDIFKQVNLRYISEFDSSSSCLCICFHLPSSISLLWNLQVLSFHFSELTAPPEIWEMAQLRHVKSIFAYLSEPHPSGDQQDEFVVLRNLQTLKTVVNLRFSEEACMRIPNIKKLHIAYTPKSPSSECEGNSSYDYCLYNIGLLHKLESFCCYDYQIGDPQLGGLLKNMAFPRSLRKLVLGSRDLRPEDFRMIGSLPNLVHVNFLGGLILGNEWNPVEGEFLRLKFLEIQYCEDLMYWNADSSHFPALEKLVLSRLSKLDEIPSGIGEIPTLGVVELDGCSESATISAVKILEEQEYLGNNGLQVRIMFWNEEDLERFTEKAKQFQSFASDNLRVYS